MNNILTLLLDVLFIGVCFYGLDKFLTKVDVDKTR